MVLSKLLHPRVSVALLVLASAFLNSFTVQQDFKMLDKQSYFNPKMDAVKITLERVQSKTICYLGQLLNKCVKLAVDDEPG